MDKDLIKRVNVREEIEEFRWDNARWSDDKLIAGSPFREDNSPSFYVWLDGADKGYFGDSGAYDDYYARGGLIKLLAYLRGESQAETIDYLLEKYGDGRIRKLDDIKIPTLILPVADRRIWIPDSVLNLMDSDYSYLESRGISEKVQQDFGIRYDAGHNSIAMPWRYADGSVGAIKYRNTAEKKFYYQAGGYPIHRMIFGLDLVYSQEINKVYITEAEIDAMSLWQLGKPAVALGHGTLNDKQAELLLKSPASEFVVASDADEVGEKIARQAKALLGQFCPVSRLNLGSYHDANDYLMKSKKLS